MNKNVVRDGYTLLFIYLIVPLRAQSSSLTNRYIVTQSLTLFQTPPIIGGLDRLNKTLFIGCILFE